MPIAIAPSPQYISFENVQPKLGVGEQAKVFFTDDPINNPNGISYVDADELIAKAEGVVLELLLPHYITAPALITINGDSWDALRTTYPATYNILYNMFVYRACFEIITDYISRNTDNDSMALGGFSKNYLGLYNSYADRIITTLPNGGYKYNLQGLQELYTNGIPRQIKTYAVGGNLSGGSYIDNQLTNPRRNYDRVYGPNLLTNQDLIKK